MENNSYFEMLQAHFALKRRAIESIKGHPRIKSQSLAELAFEEALFDGLQEFNSSRTVICDAIINRFGQSAPEVILAPALNLHDILSHYPVYQVSLFDDNDFDSIMFQVDVKGDSNKVPRFMIYPFKEFDSSVCIQDIRDKVSSDIGKPVDILPLFIREAGSLTWKPYLSDLKD